MPTKIIETEEVTSHEIQEPEKYVKTTTKVIPPAVDEGHPQKVYKTKKAIFRTYQALWYILGIIETLLAFRILLKLLGANPASGFASFIYAVSGIFAVPFIGVVSVSQSGNSVMEWSTFVAMAVYAVVIWLIVEFFQLVKPVNREEVEETVDNTSV